MYGNYNQITITLIGNKEQINDLTLVASFSSYFFKNQAVLIFFYPLYYLDMLFHMRFVQKQYFTHYYLNYGKNKEQELCTLKTHNVIQKFSHTIKSDKDKGIKRHKRPQGLSLVKKQQSKKKKKIFFVCVCVF